MSHDHVMTCVIVGGICLVVGANLGVLAAALVAGQSHDAAHDRRRGPR